MSRRTAPIAVLLSALALAACGGSSSPAKASKPATSHTTSAASAPVIGPERVAMEQGDVLAPASSTTNGTPVDGIRCAPLEQLAYHIHAHLQVYVDGVARALPGAIGILGPVADPNSTIPFYGASKCIYWLHTHTSDGIIHIESPTARIYTLGDFFKEWNQPLTADQVAGVHGTVTAIVNGKRWTKSLAAIPLNPHAAIELAIGTPVPAFMPVNWAGTGL